MKISIYGLILHKKEISYYWSGGEPFLYFNEAVVPISEYAKKCEEADIPFLISSTSNGYFLSREN